MHDGRSIGKQRGANEINRRRKLEADNRTVKMSTGRRLQESYVEEIA